MRVAGTLRLIPHPQASRRPRSHPGVQSIILIQRALAGAGVACCAKPVVQAAAAFQLNHCGLDARLHLRQRSQLTCPTLIAPDCPPSTGYKKRRSHQIFFPRPGFLFQIDL